ncbi:MAG: plasmid pRiA4b ORF-3 family protein [Methanobacterium sp.]|nr:plasmid pRiA4b ORF-3 family protein [Methanobacterium sp.]
MKDKSPSIQEWEDLYSVAVEFKKLKPWEWMWDDDIFGVLNSETEEIGYCCVMGGAGEFFGMSLYLGSEGLEGYFKIQFGEITSGDLESLYAQKCLMASFEDRDTVEDEDYQILRKLGLRFRGENSWPLFRSYLPNYMPWFLNSEEVKFLTLALEQTIHVSKRFQKNPDILRPPMINQIMVRVRDDQGWQDEWREPSEENEVMVGFVEEDALDEMFNLAHQGVWEVDYSIFPEPVQDDPRERPYFPYIITWADHEHGMVMNTTLAEPSQWGSIFSESLKEVMKSKGSLPQEILLRRNEIYNLMEGIASSLKIELTIVADLDIIDDAMEYMMDLVMNEPAMKMMEDETFRAMIEDGTLEETLEKGEIPDIMKNKLMEALMGQLEDSVFSSSDTPSEEGLSLGDVPIIFMNDKTSKEKKDQSMQTTLFPKDDSYGFNGNFTGKNKKLKGVNSETDYEQVYQFRITLKDIRPPIWRRIQVPGTFSFGDLHMAIQNAMGWENYHLHGFIMNDPAFGERITIEDNEGEEIISEWFNMENCVANYTYDYGDSWEHRVKLEKILKREKDIEYPRCIKGKRACPPEDCGGAWGYDEILKILKNPDHEEYEETLEWVGEDFNPEHFDPGVVVFMDSEGDNLIDRLEFSE